MDSSKHRFCTRCEGSGNIRETVEYRVDDVVCTDCGGEGWINNNRGKIAAEIQVIDAGVVEGDAEVEVQRWIMAWVNKKFKNDEQKVGAFFRFARAYGRQQCDAKEYYFYMQDVFKNQGAAELTPKLAMLIKDVHLRTALLKVHQGMLPSNQPKEKKTLAEMQKSIFTDPKALKVLKNSQPEDSDAPPLIA
jgi:hypothetical protein